MRILLADDHLIVRIGLASLISFEPDMTVVGEADNGIDAIRLAAKLKPDIIVMDLMMPKKNGVSATQEILQADPSTRILILTTFGTSADIRQALSFGAAGAIVKTSSQDELLSAIRKIAKGQIVISKEIERSLELSKSMPEISTRQLEILNLVAKGFTNKDISRTLGISVNSIKDHMRIVFEKLNVSTRAEAATLAVNLHLITG